MRAGAPALLGALLALTTGIIGCRDLTIPDDEAGATDPSGIPIADNLQLIEPNSAALSSPLPRSVFFRMRASAKNGVRSVTVRCGDFIELGRWETPVESDDEKNTSVLIEDRLEFDRCVAGALELAGIKDIPLVIIAEDTTELQVGRIEQTFRIDFRVAVAPVISVKSIGGSDLAPSLTSGRPLRFEVRSNEELRAPPEIRVDGKPVMLVAEDPAVRPNTWLVESQPLHLGGKRLAPGETPTTAVLEETSRTVPIEVIAQNRLGYEARLELGVPLRRIAWERNVPGILADGGYVPSGQPYPANPTASARGLTVPIVKGLNNPVDAWLPGFFDEANGAFHGTPSHRFAEWRGNLIDQSGGALLRDGSGNIAHLGFDQGDFETTVPEEPNFLRQYYPAEGKACWHVANADSTCGDTSTHRLACYGPGHDPSVPTVLAQNFDPTGAAGYTQFAAGPNSYSLFTAAREECDLPAKSYRIRNDAIEPLAISVDPFSVRKIFPLERGDFALFSSEGGSNGRVSHWGLNGAGPDGELFPLPTSDFRTGQFSRVPVAFRPNGTALFFQEQLTTNGSTSIEGWGPGGTRRGEAHFNGYYQLTDDSRYSLYPHSVVTLIDGDLLTSTRSTTYFLVHRNDPMTDGTYSVLAVDEETRPMWVWHYPRTISPGYNPPMLVGSSHGGVVYLVDSHHGVVVALAR